MDLDFPEWFDLPPNPISKGAAKEFREHPLWTEHKARLIARYISKFTYVTNHGTYIDAFAGPQRIEERELWAAKLVLELRPRRLRHFYLFEQDPESVDALKQLRGDQPPLKKGEKRNVYIYPGDCNEEILTVLKTHPIRSKEATFCLLDQRTFECHWSTVATLARHKTAGNKIELFYFLANGWIDRAVSKKQHKPAEMERWWGNSQWAKFFKLPSTDRQEFARQRFIDELGYKYAHSFPIYRRQDGGNTMYWMIHATDYPTAPRLMYQAYRNALNVKETAHQMDLIKREFEKGDSQT